MPEQYLGVKHAEPSDTLMSFLHKDPEYLRCQLCLRHPFPEQPGHALLHHPSVHVTGLYHQIQLISAFDRPDPCKDSVHSFHGFKSEILLQPAAHSKRDGLRLDVDCLRKPAKRSRC